MLDAPLWAQAAALAFAALTLALGVAAIWLSVRGDNPDQ